MRSCVFQRIESAFVCFLDIFHIYDCWHIEPFDVFGSLCVVFVKWKRSVVWLFDLGVRLLEVPYDLRLTRSRSGLILGWWISVEGACGLRAAQWTSAAA